MVSDVEKRFNAVWELIDTHVDKTALGAYILGRLITNTTDEGESHIFCDLLSDQEADFWRGDVKASVKLIKGRGANKDVVFQRALAIVSAFPAPLAEISPDPVVGNQIFWISEKCLEQFALRDLQGITFLGSKLDADWGKSYDSRTGYRGLAMSSVDVANKDKLMATFDALRRLT
jgi:hypothetical protein